MQKQLKQIYADLLAEKISKQQALDMVRALKMRVPAVQGGASLIVPEWQNCPPAGRDGPHYAEHTVVLCGTTQANTGELATLIPASHCLLWPELPGRDVAQAYRERAQACYLLVQDMLRSRPHGSLLLQIVVADEAEAALLAGLSGLFKTAAQENPRFAGQLILVEGQTGTTALARLLAADATEPQETLIRHRHGMRQAQRWQMLPPAEHAPSVAFKDGGVYLITGGLGGLGMLFAAEILQQGAASVILTGRFVLPPEKQAMLQQMGGPAGRLVYRQVDLENLASLRQLVDAVLVEHGQLNGILHAAGMIADNFIVKKPLAEFDAVLMPKVTGTLNLALACEHLELDFLVLFSSIASAMGNLSQADYATANGFMDQFALYRNARMAAQGRRGRTLSINWSLWEQGGMTIGAEILADIGKRTGIRPLKTPLAMQAFHRSLALQEGQCLIADGESARLQQWLSGPERARAAMPASAGPAPAAAHVRADTALMEKAERYLRKSLSTVLKLAPHKIDVGAQLDQYGIDSILAMRLTAELEKTFGPLSKTLFFEHQTIRALAGFMVQAHGEKLSALIAEGGQVQAASPAAAPPGRLPLGHRIRPAIAPARSDEATAPAVAPVAAASPVRNQEEPIAIIGLSGRYPESVDVGAFWENLRAGHDCVTEVPASRWDWRQYYSEDRSAAGRHYSRWGGFISGVDEFDALFFNIAPREAKFIDPQERLFLQQAWQALEDAGHTRATLEAGGEAGVYVGVMYSEYQMFGVEASMRGKRMAFNGSIASIANRVSYCLNLHGPSMTVDTMCSSSLTAIHLACQDLRGGRTSVAIAGGVNVSVHANKYLMLSAGQFISSDGQCQSFGEGGNGYIPGEGVGAVVLQRLSEAIKDGAHIYGVIRGSALSHGGRTNGYSVPNPRGQANAIQRALGDAGVSPREVSYIEAHGTGTRLGDPIEIAALNAVFAVQDGQPGAIAIGSVKSNVGHCESAAGIAALTKVLLQMKHRQIVPSLHSARLNQNIDFGSSAFTVNQSLKHWERPLIDGKAIARIAGISSFGAGGSNAHLIVEEYAEAIPAPARVSAPDAIVLSARTAAQLEQKARDLLAFISHAMSGKVAPDLASLAYTLQVGREAMDERLGLIVGSASELLSKLQAWLEGQEDIDGVYRGQPKRSREALAMFASDGDLQHLLHQWLSENKLPQLVELWVKGVDLDWPAMHGDTTPQRMSLPTYPFARDRHWIEVEAGPLLMETPARQTFDLLLHRNTSTLSQHSYCAEFSGTEFFFSARDANGAGRLSDAACLQMARAAICQAKPEMQGDMMLELHDVAWAPQAFTAGSGQINIALSPDQEHVDFEIFSGEGPQEVVHSQGKALLVAHIPPQRVSLGPLRGALDGALAGATASNADLASVHVAENQLLAELSIAMPPTPVHGDAALTLRVLQAALQAATSLNMHGKPHVVTELAGLDMVRFVSGCSAHSFAWIRHAGTSPSDSSMAELDMDIIDLQGEVQISLRGIRYRVVIRDDASAAGPRHAAHTAMIPAPAVPAPASAMAGKAAPALPLPRQVSFAVAGQHLPLGATAARAKPSAIALAAPQYARLPLFDAKDIASASPGQRPAILLRKPGTGNASGLPEVNLADMGNGIFAIDSAAAQRKGISANNLAMQLLAALAAMRSESSAKALLLYGSASCFLFQAANPPDADLSHQLYAALANAPYPVAAVMQGEAVAASFIAGSMCDFMILSEESSYGFRQAPSGVDVDPREIALLYERFGSVTAEALIVQGVPESGLALQAKGWTCAILPAAQIDAHAHKLATVLATHSQDALRLLKLHLARRVAHLLTQWTPPPPAARLLLAPQDGTGEAALAVLSHDDAITIVDLAASLDRGTAALACLFDRVGREARAALVLVCGPQVFAEMHAAQSLLLLTALEQLVAAAEFPVIVALESGAQDLAWLAGLLGDRCVYDEDACYSVSMDRMSPELASRMAVLLAQRCGDAVGTEIMLTGAGYSGAELCRRIGSVAAVAGSAVRATARTLAASLRELAPGAMPAWRAVAAQAQRIAVRALPAADADPGFAAAHPGPLALGSSVATATVHADGILVVKMEDRNARNMFSAQLVDGLNQIFAHIDATPSYKVVVMTGFDAYFASGGTKENLLAIQAGSVRFTDSRMFELALRCRIPVIAAMQGHAIGAGWSLGMFADVTLFSERSEYVSPYMNYGFTPGAGATLVFPTRIGYDLGRETLLGGQAYTGRELRDRGLKQAVLKQEQILPAALALAQNMTRLPRKLLIGLKDQLAEPLRMALDDACRREVDMHAQTFVGRSDTRARIEQRFGKTAGAGAAQALPAAPARANAAAPDPAPDMLAGIKALLAAELQMPGDDIDDGVQFVDLGLDSVSGVTWIRKINEQYGTEIEATKIYSHPTLKQLGAYVHQQIRECRAVGGPDVTAPPAAGGLAPEGSVADMVLATARATAGKAVPATVPAAADHDTAMATLADLKNLLAHELETDAGEIDDSVQFVDLGLDSVSGVTWVRKINEKYRIDIDATKIYSYPTLQQLSAYVRQQMGAHAVEPATAVKVAASTVPMPESTAAQGQYRTAAIPALASRRRGNVPRATATAPVAPQSGPIAVVGMAGQFPQARDVDEFWRNIAAGKDCIIEVPAERWDSGLYYQPGEAASGKTNSRWMGALEDYDCFDPLFFNISPSEAECMDPQQRLFLQTCWQAIEHAGYDAQVLSGTNCGVFAGCAGSDYHQGAAEQRLSAQSFTGGASSILSARISYFLNLQGPCLAIDTACSSSLVAIANACDSLNSGVSDMALAGGVYVMAGPDMHIRTAQTGMLSSEGRCFSFDQRANGFVPGEAVATVLLKRLADAQRDGDTIYGVIRGWGVNQDGRTNGITAPNPEAQARLQRDVYERYQIDPGDIGLIEAHGTGTKLGDPLEVQALKEAFSHYTRKADYCALGSVKSNIGHCLTAAGATGFIKLLQALRHRQLPPTIQFEQLNEHIKLDGSPFYVNDRLRTWETPEGKSRMAAISSFGFSGTNAHIVVEEYAIQDEPPCTLPPQRNGSDAIVPLSARTAGQLRQRASDLLAVLASGAPNLAQLAYTLQAGREAMEVRHAFLVDSVEELRRQLQAYLAGRKRADPGLPHQEDLARRMAQWIGGGQVDWNELYRGVRRPQRIGLPAYPFAKERYWIDAAPVQHATPPVPKAQPASAATAGDRHATLLVPGWKTCTQTRRDGQLYAEHVVILCGTTEVSTGELATLIPASHCLLWPALPHLDAAQAYRERALACFQVVQGMLRSRTQGKLLLQVVVADEPDLALLSGLSGLLKTAAQENPQFAGQVILVEAQTRTPVLARLLGADAGTPQETLVRHRQGVRQVQRWEVASVERQPAPMALKDGGVYLITGGLGAIGMLFAADMLQQTSQAKIILTGRSVLTPQKQALLQQFNGAHGRLVYRQADLECLASVEALMHAVIQEHGQLNGILHCAGMVCDNYILNKPMAEFEAVLAPKVTGTLNLAVASEHLELDFLALFSSIASALGNSGQADYAAGNGFMDQFAAYRNAQMAAQGRRGRTLSINWSLWQHGGMRIGADLMASIAELTGMQPLHTAAALRAFHEAMALTAAQCLVVEGDMARLSAFLGQEAAVTPQTPNAGQAADVRLLTERTLHNMKQIFGAAIKLAPGRIDENREFSAYGVDSLMVTKLNAEFGKIFGRISKTLVFEYKNLAALTAYFLEQHRAACVAWSGMQANASPPQSLVPAPAAPAPMPQPARAAGAGHEHPIAIVGISGMFPQAATLAQYWENLRSGKDSVTEIPPERWSLQSFYEADVMRAVELGKSYCKWGGFVDQFDQFDSLFFGISPRDAMSMDPQERLFLQAAYHALEDAGYTRADLRDKFQRQVGVFAGITKQGFNLHGTEASRRDRKFYPQTSFGSVANRLSYFLDITGPSMPIDTMCSSSLTAVHEACEQIRRGECSLAIAGAVNLYTHPSNYIDMAAQYALSRDGRCRSFGSGANGFVPGEGVGVLLLRPLADALADGDVIHGLILGTHVNHGGKTNGYTVPNPRAQADLIARAIEKAGINARDISYMEAHGTGTELGDPIEIEGLRQAFARHTSDTGYCRIGSAKSNIGHLEAAAGMAGIAKILLQMQHAQIVPSLHAGDLNPAIDFAATPFVVNTSLTPWEPVGPDGRALPRIAGISAFGAGGANAHVILQQFVPADYPHFCRHADAGRQAIVPLSARNPEQLLELAASMLAFVEGLNGTGDLGALAYTLQTGRESMDQRVCFVVDSLAGLALRLRAFVTGGAHIDGVFAGQVQRFDSDVAEVVHDEGMQAAAATWLADRNLGRLAQWWARGLAVDWTRLYEQGAPVRISLPGYPFAQDRYWPGVQPAPAGAAVPQCTQQLSKAIDDIVSMVDSDALETDEALRKLHDLLGH
ncbi:SDR family NAD(P)-dependent oxidoreductase [Janthinobacterium sp. FT14W]|uniref:SDR family NAD(P)-dependent oxidoreductase n=1 Tax=Janthinobacterium sp. FT14W TaxID=2654253 RepID=UPI00186B39A8|nr:SDR family NAD(P)-dependent oxidoreductase [Janthinobacterium sp. FT14W]